MKSQHNPVIDLRYWALINLVSVFGTNTGDAMVRLFKQLSGNLEIGRLVGHMGPLPVLILAYVINAILEQGNDRQTELFFWTAIILIRTAATNIADTLLGDLHIPFALLSGVLGLAMIVCARRWQAQRPDPTAARFLPTTGHFYWSCMLVAGVLGTIVGDELWHVLGLPVATPVLALLTLGLIATGYNNFLKFTALYWLGVVGARVAGTAAGDWLAKSHDRGGAGFDVFPATLASGAIFFLVLMVWRAASSHEAQTSR